MTGKSETLPTICKVPYDLWEEIHPVILEMDPPKSTGRKRVDPRRVLDGIIFRVCAWTRDITIQPATEPWRHTGTGATSGA